MEILKVKIETAGYRGKPKAIQDIRFSVKQGEMVGIIGSNGAGKSTTIKGILGLLPELFGEIEFLGANKTYAYIPEQPVLYDGMTLWEHLELAASVNQMPRETFITRGEELLARFHLSKVKHHFPTTFSKGMQQKLMLIIGFLIQPDLYIVDEPFIGLDPRATKELITLLNEARAQGAGVLMSTHVLDMAERLCNAFILLANGSLIAYGNLQEIKEQCHLTEGGLYECFDSLMEEA
jgi:ABC-2 type transport system ATP-binding protein